MATAEQIKALLKSHAERDDSRFYSVALQLAAKEARKGHVKLADDIKKIVEKSQSSSLKAVSNEPVPLKRVNTGDLQGLLEYKPYSVRLNELVLPSDTVSRFEKIITEQRQKDKLRKFGLAASRKLMFVGPPGTGKTMSASMLATELKLPIFNIVLDSLITRFMGETASKLRAIFDHIKQTRAVYLFDEFDAIGAQRSASNDVGEIRRVLNSLLMFIEQDESDSIIIAATNHPELLDKALHRRFDHFIHFTKPDNMQIEKLISHNLSLFDLANVNVSAVSELALGLSSAEVARACDDAAKEAVLHNNTDLTQSIIIEAFERRKSGKQLFTS
ncbi:MAG: ATP-binding protein [Aestuariibacter sp.]|jgi:SpoVK/Ycf46/Vps4 family AAA+-type ATPase|nr:ATP-binding protein [Aestuariibacter sp.]MCP4233024.1 ATP-binding protein [Aestuariibacter sp.]MCP4527550.1 ATP-binding protein [Aestuariibacter sp.]BBO27133.1 ATPase [Alteromonas sp. I4]